MAKRSRPAKPFSAKDPIAEILEAWRLWLLGALIGAVLAWVFYFVAPPDYRARATVVVDNNLEEAWVFFPDRQLFQFLQRETEKLEQLAWSDDVMEVVASASGISIDDLRGNVLQLSQPSDGGWHFFADHPDMAVVQTLSLTWAQAFVDAARSAVEASPEVEQARRDLEAALLAGANESEIQEITEQVSSLAEQTKGISPFVELYASQQENLPIDRSVSQGTYLLVGSVIGALVLPLWFILRPKTYRSRV